VAVAKTFNSLVLILDLMHTLFSWHCSFLHYLPS